MLLAARKQQCLSFLFLFPLFFVFLWIHVSISFSPSAPVTACVVRFVRAGLVQFPMDTVCRRMMMAAGERKFYSSTLDAVMRLSKTEGSRAFYSGVPLAMLIEAVRGVVHKSCGSFLERVYQSISDALNELPRGMCSNVGDSAFDAWIQRQARNSLISGKDPKDTEDFKFLTFSEIPPFTSKHRSLMAKFMSPGIWSKCSSVKTSKGFSLSHLIQCGVFRPSLGLGLVLGDEECCDVFKDLVNPIVKTWHKFDPHTQSHKSDLSPSKLKIAEAQRKRFDEFVICCCVKGSRNVSGYPLQPATSREDKIALETFFRDAAASLVGELKGTFLAPHALSPELRCELEREGMVFDKPLKTQYLAVCGGARHWPTGRGVIMNTMKTYIMSINQEDHVRLVSKQNGADIQACFARFCQLSQHLKEAALAQSRDLMFSDRLGFLTTSIADLGIRASIFIRAPLFRLPTRMSVLRFRMSRPK